MTPEMYRWLGVEPIHNLDYMHFSNLGFDCCFGCAIRRAAAKLRRMREKKLIRDK